jgi:hypothetical protein
VKYATPISTKIVRTKLVPKCPDITSCTHSCHIESSTVSVF